MVLDSDRRLGPGTVTGPLDMAGNHILRALEPLKTNDRDCAALDFAALNTTVCEHIDLFSRCCRLGSMHDPPSFATERRNLLRGSQSWTLRSERETIIDLVSTSRPDRFDRPKSDPIPFLCNHFAKFAHRPLVSFAER
jgi:hypothetical protein